MQAALHSGAIGAGFTQPSVELHEGLTRLVAGAMGYPARPFTFGRRRRGGA